MNLFKSDKKIYKKSQSNVPQVGKRSIATLFTKNIIIVFIGITVVLGCNVENDDNLQAEIDVLKTQINALSSSSGMTITDLQNTITTLQTQLNALSSSSGMTITDLQNTITTLQTQLSSLSGASAMTIDTLQTQINALSGSDVTITDFQNTITTLQTQLNALSGSSGMTITNLQNTINALQTQVNALSGESDITVLQNQISGLSTREFNTLSAAGNNSPNGLWSDGETMWVADNFDMKIYAYNLGTKVRDAAKDLIRSE